MTTKRFIALVLVVVVAAGLFVAFITLPWDSSDSSRNSVPVYTAGQSIAVDQGNQFVIALAANRSTGYSWKAETNDNVEQVKSRYEQGDSKLMGAGGTQFITFKATKRGSTTLQVDYARSFEKGTEPAKTESFPVRVG